ncbi:MAG TPA: VOC family protein [Rhodanobacteraceae bacterium]|nr:VOC family protein [Rhodanobacteraceae bacterium]
MQADLQGVHPVLASKDVAASVQFFRDLGFELLFQDAPDAPKYAGVTRDNVELHIQWASSEQWSYPVDRPVYRFIVRDVDALYAEFLARGRINANTGQGGPWAVPADTPWGTREFHLRDPSLNILQFYAPR